VQRGVLPDGNVAPGLQERKRELERHMRRDSLDKKLERRAEREDLVERKGKPPSLSLSARACCAC
jgi:hypothetical protein